MTTAATPYQNILQRFQRLMGQPATATSPVPGPAPPPAMPPDAFVRTAGFPMPPHGYFQPGLFGPQVAALQTHLGALGYLAGSPDQFYANGTIEAVRYFQMDYGLPATGTFDWTAYQTMMAVFNGQLPWKRAPIAQPQPVPQPAAPATPGNPLGVDWQTSPAPAQPEPKPQPPKPEPKPEPKPQPPKPKPNALERAIEALKRLSPAELTRMGQNDKKRFFEVLRPAAEESERKHGVPAAVTLAQAALETGWGKSIIPGFNIFGIKGTGPAGTISKQTWEHYDGKDVTITANFAKYHNFYEAVSEHGKRFHNGYYDKAINAYAKKPDPFQFARNITGIYATDPNYGNKLITLMQEYDLV